MSKKAQTDALFEKYYGLYNAKIKSFCHARLSGSDSADDCAQEVFVVFYNQLLKGTEINNVLAFLYRTADNIVKAQWRKNKKREKIISLDEVSETLSDNTRALAATAEFTILPKAVSKIKLSSAKTVIFNPSGEALPNVKVYDGDKLLTKNTDYKLIIDKNADTKNCGEVNYTVAGIGNYNGVVNSSYTIVPRSVKKQRAM